MVTRAQETNGQKNQMMKPADSCKNRRRSFWRKQLRV